MLLNASGGGGGLGGSKLVLDINKNQNNICLGCGFWATGHKSHNPWGGEVSLGLLTSFNLTRNGSISKQVTLKYYTSLTTSKSYALVIDVLHKE